MTISRKHLLKLTKRLKYFKLLFVFAIFGIGVTIGQTSKLDNKSTSSPVKIEITPTPTIEARTGNWKVLKDETYKFSFKVPQYYDIEPKEKDNSAFSTAVWEDTPRENLRYMQIRTLDKSSWEVKDGGSVKYLYLRHFTNTTYSERKKEFAKSDVSFIVNEFEIGPDAMVRITADDPFPKKSDFDRETALVFQLDGNVLEISTHHFKPNQPDVNDLLVNIYSTFIRTN